MRVCVVLFIFVLLICFYFSPLCCGERDPCIRVCILTQLGINTNTSLSCDVREGANIRNYTSRVCKALSPQELNFRIAARFAYLPTHSQKSDFW